MVELAWAVNRDPIHSRAVCRAQVLDDRLVGVFLDGRVGSTDVWVVNPQTRIISPPQH